MQTEVPFQVTPRVVDESIATIMYAEGRWWTREAASLDLSPGDLPIIVDSAREGVARWASEHLTSETGALRLVGNDDRAREDCLNLEAAIPDSIFTDVNMTKAYADRTVVCKALVSSSEMLLTRNVKSINHDALNLWVIQSRLRSQAFIFEPDTGLQRLLGDRTLEMAHISVVAMAIPNVHEDEKTDRNSVSRFLDDLWGSFPRFVEEIRLLEGLPEIAQPRWETARSLIEQPEWQVARKAEEERIRTTRDAVRDRGFDFELYEAL